METYWKESLRFLAHLQEHSDEDTDEVIDDMMLFYNNIVKTSETKQWEGVDIWIESMTERMDTKTVKYVKAVDRILATTSSSKSSDACTACVYHAIAYRDLEAMTLSSTSNTLQRLDLKTRVQGCKWTPDAASVMWEQMDAMTRAAYAARGKTPPEVPTRDAISKEIQSKKSKQHSGGGTSSSDPSEAGSCNSFMACGVAILKVLDKTDVDANEADFDAARELVSSLLNDAAFENKVKDCDEGARLQILTCLPGTNENVLVPEAVSSEVWSLTHQLVTATKIGKAVSANVMKTIEQYAAGLADDVVNGKLAFGDMDLEKIGTDVMSRLSEKDIDDIMTNMPNLMPWVGNAMNAMGNMQPR